MTKLKNIEQKSKIYKGKINILKRIIEMEQSIVKERNKISYEINILLVKLAKLKNISGRITYKYYVSESVSNLLTNTQRENFINEVYESVKVDEFSNQYQNHIFYKKNTLDDNGLEVVTIIEFN